MNRLPALLLLLPLLLLPARAGADATGLSRWSEVIAVFDRLEMPAVEGKTFVLANSGGYTIYGSDESLEFHYTLGWILEETEESVTLFTNSLVRSRIPKHAEFPPKWEKFKDSHPENLPLPGEHRVLGFEEFCSDFLGTGVEDYFGAFQHFSSGGLHHAVEAALYGYWARERGDAALARRLFELGEKSAKEYFAHRSGEDRGLLEFVTGTLATSIRARAISYANAGAPRDELLHLWRMVLAVLGEEDADEAKEMISLYEQMIAEDAAWREPAPEVREALPPAKRAEYWLHHLRDLAERQWSQPGSCSVFGFGVRGDRDARSEHAAVRLRELGPDAVPLLIEHLDDHRPTRCMGYWRNFAPESYYLLRVGDACQEILSAIAGRGFFARRSSNSHMQKDEATEGVRRAALAWWKEYREKGEEGILADGTAAGGRDSPAQGRKLLEKYPEAALAAIARGIRAATEEWPRASLVRLLGRIEGDGPVPLLLDELRSGPFLATRLAAAELLLERGHEAALPAMLAEWEGTRGPTHRDAGAHEALIALLIRAGRADAVRALAADWYDRPVGLRYEVVEAFNNLPPPPETRDAIEDLLVAALSDEAPRTGLSCSWGDVHFSNPRICDLAGYMLAKHFPDRYEFDIEAKLAERNRRILAMRNLWRRARGLEEEPPPRPAVEPVSDDVTGPLLRKLRDLPQGERAEPIDGLDRLGLGALPAVRAAAERQEFAEVKDVLVYLAARLSVIVREAAPDRHSRPLPEGLVERIRALRGRPLTAKGLLGLVHWWLRHSPGQQVSLRIEALRPGDDSGVTVRAGLEVPDADESFEEGRLKWKRHVSLGGRSLLGGTSHGSWNGIDERYLSERIGECLAAAPEEPFRIVLVLRAPAGD